ncbi:hypothetical protein AG1IA_04451 [Rhizoctonia solani AG-1 IA]|uniref:Altered inheritance of mitochondria protein 6 n=1 Tax=Thanatephorus cucumeris (strain AG1-IA) TaxID=983506 RepID=L8WXG6_THACA|nr:hypothetical protein AG1IA_04451 [Rhizoctonia solani AG-1 IA]
MENRRASLPPEPNPGSFLIARKRTRNPKTLAGNSPSLKALSPLVLLALAVLVMWPPSFSVMRGVVTGLGLVASIAPSFAYRTIDEVITDWKNQPQSTYPTQFTRGIIPKGIRAFLDLCRQDVPLFSAIAVGAISVEADVWLWDNELYVGSHHHGSFPYTNNTRYGVFDTVIDQTLYLFVDVKTDGNTTWPLVIKQLEPLREGGWLSYWDAETGVLRPGAVTVVGTGNTPFDQIQAHTTLHRDAFYDAPITSFSSDSLGEYNTSSVVIASGSLANALGGSMSGSTFNDTQIDILARQIQGAHAAGVKVGSLTFILNGRQPKKFFQVRYWETPGWPLSKRDYVWKTLEGLGVDLLNADDIQAAAGLKEVW